jgi:hypothetical protein
MKIVSESEAMVQIGQRFGRRRVLGPCFLLPHNQEWREDQQRFYTRKRQVVVVECQCGKVEVAIAFNLLHRTSDRRNTIWVTAFGETKALTAWADDSRCLVKCATFRKRVESGISPEEAMTMPLNKTGHPIHQ